MRAERAVRTIQERLTAGSMPLLVALDGRSGVGKSTLAAQLAERFDAVVVSGDDFFAGGSDEAWAQRSPAERANRCIDWRRLRREALEPLLTGSAAVWRPFYATGPDAALVTAAPKPVIVLDGVYSGRPELADVVDLAVFVTMADDAERRRRLTAREGAEFMAAWHALWDAAEDHYFSTVAPSARFDLVVSSTNHRHLPETNEGCRSKRSLLRRDDGKDGAPNDKS